jgi:hypothetical protein
VLPAPFISMLHVGIDRHTTSDKIEYGISAMPATEFDH